MTTLGNFVMKTEVKEKSVAENKTNKIKSRGWGGKMIRSQWLQYRQMLSDIICGCVDKQITVIM